VELPPFEAIVEEHGAVVLRVCRAVLGPHDAQDAWSETFVAAMRAYPELRPGSNVRGWLVTIAHRKAIDAVRARTRRPDPSPALEVAAPEGTGPTLDDDLAEALRALPPKQQAAVVHHYLAELPYREVAELLGTSVDAARRSAADGIAALRATFVTGERS
jgi:RNA polymerase sigma factor (sigma-70 family)